MGSNNYGIRITDVVWAALLLRMAGLPKPPNITALPPIGNPSKEHSTKTVRSKLNPSKGVWLRFSSLCRLEADRWPALHRRVSQPGGTGTGISNGDFHWNEKPFRA